MAEFSLKGKKVAVLVESQYIPEEIRVYQQRFGRYDAEVHLMSNLWDQPSITFVSEVEQKEQTPELLTVTVDFRNVVLEEYAAVIIAANYVSVRLRYFQPPVDAASGPAPISPEMTRLSPAVQFFARAMRNTSIIKGALCHGLWLLTPVPELLAGRRVICHEVVLSDIANAGALYTPNPSNVVVDRDLVTGRTYHEAEELVDRIAELIGRGQTGTAPGTGGPPVREAKKDRNVLIVVSGKGYWGEELIGPMEVLDEAGYSMTFVTPDGRRPVALPPSYDENYIDPALGRPVTSPTVAAKVRELDRTGEPRSEYSRMIDNPTDLRTMMPERPYICHPAFVHVLEAYYAGRARAWLRLEGFDALLLVGGSGPVVDMVNNQRVHDLILGFYYQGKPIAAECYAIGCLAFAREITGRDCILRGRTVTGHCLEYDYKAFWGWIDYSFGAPPYPQEYLLKDAVGPDGLFLGNFGRDTSTIVDHPFITGRSTSDGYPVGRALVDVLEHGVRRMGW